MSEINVSRDLSRPPGGLVVWLFITVELMTFGGAMLVFLAHRSSAIESFKASQAKLNPTFGFANTVLLLTSGYFVAQAVQLHKKGRLDKVFRHLFLGGLLGSGFLVLKLFEYGTKWAAGDRIGANDFFSYYWGFTGFHFLHVVIGVFFLFALAIGLKKGKTFADEDAGVEAGAAFWHMCDLIWILLFPLLYLL